MTGNVDRVASEDDGLDRVFPEEEEEEEEEEDDRDETDPNDRISPCRSTLVLMLPNVRCSDDARKCTTPLATNSSLNPRCLRQYAQCGRVNATNRSTLAVFMHKSHTLA